MSQFPAKVIASKLDFGLELLPPQSEWFERNLGNLELLRKYFSTLWVCDHFQWDGSAPWYEGWTTLSYLAGKFPTFEFGNLVLCVSYRNPALVARMASTFQYLTGGKLILGLGAGWYKEEYDSYGYEFPRTYGERLDRLGKACQIIKTMWSESPASFQGKYYHIKDAYCEPKPKDRIPLLIGVGNNYRALRVVAKYADMYNDAARVNVIRPARERLDSICSEMGRDPKEIKITCLATPKFTSDANDFKAQQEKSGNSLLGPDVDSVVQELRQLADLGVMHIQVRCTDEKSLSTFCEEVIPSFRD